jgi:hypothetical protein
MFLFNDFVQFSVIFLQFSDACAQLFDVLLQIELILSINLDGMLAIFVFLMQEFILLFDGIIFLRCNFEVVLIFELFLVHVLVETLCVEMTGFKFLL